MTHTQFCMCESERIHREREQDIMTVITTDKKVAAQFSKVAKVKALTEQLRQKHGTTITRKELKAFEKNHKLVVQWVARREEPVQKFRTPLGFVRSGRGAYAIPADPTVLVNETGIPVTVTAPEGLPASLVVCSSTPLRSHSSSPASLSADEQAVANLLGVEDSDAGDGVPDAADVPRV